MRPWPNPAGEPVIVAKAREAAKSEYQTALRREEPQIGHTSTAILPTR